MNMEKPINPPSAYNRGAVCPVCGGIGLLTRTSGRGFRCWACILYAREEMVGAGVVPIEKAELLKAARKEVFRESKRICRNI
jgi:hypothetical protein